MKRCKILSILLSILLVTTIVTPNVQAAVKINKSTANIYVGETLTLKVSGTSSKPTWSTSNKKVATVSSYGKVSAKSEGIATIKAKVKNKTLTCKITVKKKFSAVEAIKNLNCKYYEYNGGVVAIIKNNYSYNMSIDATAVFYGLGNKMLDKSSDRSNLLRPGATCALYFYGPTDSDYNTVKYSNYKVTYSCEATDSIDLSKKIKLSYNDGADKVMIEASNNNDESFEFAVVSIVFFKNGEVVGYDSTYLDCEKPGTESYISFDYPYDNDYNTIYPDDYEVYINYAMRYN